jgi:hypothetical protein
MLELTVRQKLIEYVASRISLQEFQRWFVPATWDVHLSGEQGAIDLAYRIELRLAEYTSGHLPENQLRSELGELLCRATFTVGRAVSVIQTSDNATQVTWQTTTSGAVGQLRSFGTLSVEVLA